MRAADAKAAKNMNNSNLGSKFLQTQQMWSRPTRSMTQVRKKFVIIIVYCLSPLLIYCVCVWSFLFLQK